MKRILTLLLVFLGFQANAATKSKSTIKVDEVRPLQRPFRVVPYAGLASFKIIGMESESRVRNDAGLAVGGLLDYKINRQITAQGGLGYYQLGARGSFSGAPVNWTLQLEYLAIHTAAKYSLDGRYAYLKGGLSPLINLHSTAEVKAPGFDNKGKVNNIRDMDILAQMGVGIELPAQKNINFGAELTYNRGLLDVTTGGNDLVYNEGILFTGFASL